MVVLKGVCKFLDALCIKKWSLYHFLMNLGRHLLNEKNMAEVMQCNLRLSWRRPCHFYQFLLGLVLGAFSHHVSPATLGQPSQEMMWR